MRSSKNTNNREWIALRVVADSPQLAEIDREVNIVYYLIFKWTIDSCEDYERKTWLSSPSENFRNRGEKERPKEF